MKRMTVREIRLHWPRAEQNLQQTGEIVVTRDGNPVARIVPYSEAPHSRKPRWSAVDQKEWLRRFWKGRVVRPTTGELLARDRER
jgi:antitoxin (DNA-binding transcriptional repressor) of toxin-antitoxin stability system